MYASLTFPASFNISVAFSLLWTTSSHSVSTKAIVVEFHSTSASRFPTYVTLGIVCNCTWVSTLFSAPEMTLHVSRRVCGGLNTSLFCSTSHRLSSFPSSSQSFSQFPLHQLLHRLKFASTAITPVVTHSPPCRLQLHLKTKLLTRPSSSLNSLFSSSPMQLPCCSWAQSR